MNVFDSPHHLCTFDLNSLLLIHLAMASVLSNIPTVISLHLAGVICFPEPDQKERKTFTKEKLWLSLSLKKIRFLVLIFSSMIASCGKQ